MDDASQAETEDETNTIKPYSKAISYFKLILTRERPLTTTGFRFPAIRKSLRVYRTKLTFSAAWTSTLITNNT